MFLEPLERRNARKIHHHHHQHHHQNLLKKLQLHHQPHHQLHHHHHHQDLLSAKFAQLEKVPKNALKVLHANTSLELPEKRNARKMIQHHQHLPKVKVALLPEVSAPQDHPMMTNHAQDL